jgi:hypothetical protein
MKQDNRNSVSVIQRNLDETIKVNPIEDGNTPGINPNQGYMYTSEINDSDYAEAYKFTVDSIFSNKTVTGSNSYFQITVSYEVTDESIYGGWFGNNLIKAGDTFVLKDDLTYDFNWVKGSVVAISNVNVNSTNAPIITYTYTLACAFTEGLTDKLPQGVLNPGDVDFYTDRRIFMDRDDKAPINLLSSIRDGKVQFTWDDPTNTAVKYNFTFRSEDNSYDNGITLICGNSYNFNGELKAKINSIGEVSAVKIVDPGISIGWQVALPTAITSTVGVTPPTVVLFNDGCGSLGITEYKIVEVSSVTSNTITCKVFLTAQQIIGNAIWPRTYVDLYQNKQLGEATISVVGSVVGEYTNIEIEYESPFTYSTLADAQLDLIGKKFKAHTGAYVPGPGSGMNKEPKLECDKYNENTKNVINIGNFPGAGTYYWKVASIFDCNQKSFTEWSQEAKLIIS